MKEAASALGIGTTDLRKILADGPAGALEAARAGH
jgi:hypothetical protein